VGNLPFLLFDGGMKAIFLSETVGSAGPPYSVGKEASWHQQNSKSWSLEFTWMCVAGSWHLVASWGYPWGSKTSGVESSGAQRQQRSWDLFAVELGFQEWWQLLQGQRTQIYQQQKPWNLLTGAGLPRAKASLGRTKSCGSENSGTSLPDVDPSRVVQ
jgi:hypothetical protein